jgi:hypothetical protein
MDTLTAFMEYDGGFDAVFTHRTQADTIAGTVWRFVMDGNKTIVAVPATRLEVTGTLTASLFAGNAGSLTNLLPTAIVGTLNASQIPSLDASKLTSGTFNTALIPALDAAKVTTGTLDPNRVPALDAAKLATGVLDAARVPGLDSAKLISGTLNDARLSANIARIADLVATNAALVARVIATNDALLTQLSAVSNYARTNIPATVTVASADAADAALLAQGFQRIVTTAAPAWVAGTTTGEPSARELHTATWTGNELMIWGGFGSGGYLGTGGRYNPTNQTWLATSTSGAPAARDRHVALWTGSRLLIWGGRNAGGALGDGATYVPTTDTWAAFSLSGTPTARQQASAVWTGTRANIWGGDAAGELNTGAQLLFDGAGNPTAWQATSTVGAPSARRGHVAVWTGTRMLVWGGASGGNFLADGASYDPLGDTWTTLSTTNAPSARANAVGAWTGTELVLFGGHNGSAPVAGLQRLQPLPAWHLFRKL